MKKVLVGVFVLILSFKSNGSTNLPDSSYYWIWNNSSGVWQLNSKTFYTYDSNGNLIVQLLQTKTGNYLVNNQRKLYVYDANNNQTIYTEQVWNGNNWVSQNQDSSVYDTNNNLTSIYHQVWYMGSYSQWLTLFTYDISNNLLSEMEGDELYTYSYDSSNHQTQNLYQLWKDTVWENERLVFYTYDLNDNRTSLISQAWNGSNWENGAQRIYIYDLNNNLITDSALGWYYTYWYTQKQYLYTYDAHNNRLSRTDQNKSGSNWNNTYRVLYSYDLNDDLLSKVAYDWKFVYWENKDSTHYYYKTFTAISFLPPVTANFSLSPNPATTQLNITIDETLTGAQLNIYDITGALVQSTVLQIPNSKLQIPNLPTGVYIAEVKTKEVSVKKRWVKM